MSDTEIKKVTVYICQNCGEEHRAYSDARSCCPPIEHTRYQCPTCGELYEDQTLAEECCYVERLQKRIGCCEHCQQPLREDQSKGKYCANANCPRAFLSVKLGY